MCWRDLLPRWEGEVRCDCESERCVVEKGEKRMRNARIRILLLKLYPADPEVWRVEVFRD